MRDDSTPTIDAISASASVCAYRAPVLVRFAHCDPAGMVFFPRYLEMFNNLVEDWCSQGLQISFAEMHLERGWGLATTHLDVNFVAPSYLGEELCAALEVRKIGTSSVRLDIALRGVDGGVRVRGQMVLVMIDMKSKRARALPNDVRARMAVFQAES